MNPRSSFKVASDDDVLPILSRYCPDLLEIYKKIDVPAAKSDCARLALLYEFGGWYLDFDTFPRTSLDFYESKNKDLYLSYLVQDNSKVTLPNSPIGGRARHPYFLEALNYIAAMLRSKINHYSVYNSTGPTAALAAAGAFINLDSTSYKNIDYSYLDVNGDQTKGSWTYQESCGVWSSDENPVIFNDGNSEKRLGAKGSLEWYVKQFDRYPETKKDNYRKMLRKLAVYYINELGLVCDVCELSALYLDKKSDKNLIQGVLNALKKNNEFQSATRLENVFYGE